MKSHNGEKIAKIIANAGVCSRRDAESLIKSGRVEVNGKTLRNCEIRLFSTNNILVDGEKIPEKEHPRLWRFHKPAGLVTTHKDEKNRITVFSKLPKYLPRVISIGRLDINSEGLLLLTNNGSLANKLAHPSLGWTRRYRVRVHGKVNNKLLDKVRNGITISNFNYKPIHIAINNQNSTNTWLTLTLKEGKKREIRIIMDHIGLSVNRLIRISFGPFQLGSLEPERISEVPNKTLKEQLGKIILVNKN
ncbi:MAG: pseudouridine synthase [Pseudomonadota bacterium]|nr:pseudouridine synthase [Pseudomonadota bacterium]